MIFGTHRLTVAGQCAGRDDEGRFWWWFWLPAVHTNGGRWSLGEVVDVSACWLCFSVSVTLWPKRREVRA